MICNTDVEAIFSPAALSLYLSHATLACLMVVITITLNSTFLATMLFQKTGQRSISNKLLMTLSVIDLLIGALVWPLVAAFSFKIYSIDVSSCDFINATIFLGYQFSMLTLCVIFLVALDQYLAILHPYSYISKVTYPRFIWPMIGINSLLLLFSIIVKIKFQKIWINSVQIVFLPIAMVIVASLIYVYRKVVVCVSRITKDINSTNKEEGRQIKSRAKAAKSSLIILIGTLICYLPVICYNIYVRVRGQTSYGVTFIGYPSQIMGLFTSVIDPAVYYWRLSTLRKATKNMFSSICKKKNQVRSVPGAQKTALYSR